MYVNTCIYSTGNDNRQQNQSSEYPTLTVDCDHNVKGKGEVSERERTEKKHCVYNNNSGNSHERRRRNEKQSNITLRLKHNRFGERNVQALLISAIHSMLEYEAAAPYTQI